MPLLPLSYFIFISSFTPKVVDFDLLNLATVKQLVLEQFSFFLQDN